MRSRSILMWNGRRAAMCVALTGLALLSSCGPVFSIHPWYTDKDIVFEPRLLGTWFDPTDTNDHDEFVIEKSGGNAYTITLTDPEKKPTEANSFEAHLFRLGDHLFLDATQSDIQVAGENVDVYAVSGHMLARVSLDGDVLNLSFLDDDWMQKGLQAGTISIRHEDQDDGTPVLTATTAELQKFALDHVSDDKAFSAGAMKLQQKK